MTGHQAAVDYHRGAMQCTISLQKPRKPRIPWPVACEGLFFWLCFAMGSGFKALQCPQIAPHFGASGVFGHHVGTGHRHRPGRRCESRRCRSRAGGARGGASGAGHRPGVGCRVSEVSGAPARMPEVVPVEVGAGGGAGRSRSRSRVASQPARQSDS